MYIKIDQHVTHAFTSWHDWGSPASERSPFSFPRAELLHSSSSTTQNERSTHVYKRPWHYRERRHILRGEWNSWISAQQADGVDLWQINNNNGNGSTPDGVIPIMPNPSNRFTGRTEVIAELKTHFSNADGSAQKRKVFLLHGMGGIGKTQICLKFVEEMCD